MGLRFVENQTGLQLSKVAGETAKLLARKMLYGKNTNILFLWCRPLLRCG